MTNASRVDCARFRDYAQSMIRHLLVTALLAATAACGFASPPPSASVRVELSWNTDADLDLEIWRDGDTGLAPIGESFYLSTYSVDQVDGRDGRVERFVFRAPYDSGSYVVAVGFWGEGPGKNPLADVTVAAYASDGSLTGKFTGRLDDDTRDLWFACRVDAVTGAAESIDSSTYRGM